MSVPTESEANRQPGPGEITNLTIYIKYSIIPNFVVSELMMFSPF